MPFSTRPYRRFHVHCAAIYNAGPFQYTKQDRAAIITEFRRKNPCAQIPETAFPALIINAPIG